MKLYTKKEIELEFFRLDMILEDMERVIQKIANKDRICFIGKR